MNANPNAVSSIESPTPMIRHYFREMARLWYVKAPLVSLAALIYGPYNFGLLPDALSIFQMDPQLLLIATAMIIFDVLTGVYRSYRKEIPIRVVYLRRSVTWKVVETAVVVLIFTLIDNGFAGYVPFSYVTQFFSEAAFFWVITTEGWSAVENVMLSKERAGKIIQAILAITRNPKDSIAAIDEAK